MQGNRISGRNRQNSWSKRQANALGFVSRPLYLFPEFMRNKPIELFFRDSMMTLWIAKGVSTQLY
ncbi:MAG TPA: DUF4277 domain-containing protein [Methanosarcinales archaeon]|nr:DUF4277 domain-containing protein [Methanosarcinales archaeon]